MTTHPTADTTKRYGIRIDGEWAWSDHEDAIHASLAAFRLRLGDRVEERTAEYEDRFIYSEKTGEIRGLYRVLL